MLWRRSRCLAIACAMLLGSQSARGSSFSCEGTAGSVLFENTLYGMAVGGILTGLYVWSRSDDKGFDREQNFANGTLTGAVLGSGLGIFEIAKRDCASPRSGAAESSVRLHLTALPTAASSSLMGAAIVSWSL